MSDQTVGAAVRQKNGDDAQLTKSFLPDELLGSLARLRVDQLSLHPACDLVPEMSAREWTEFLADVGRRGIQEPLVVQNGKILDGRHRFKAAELTEAETVLCRLVELPEAEQEQFVIASALHRRQLSDDQRAMMASKYHERLVKESKAERASKGGAAGGIGRSTKEPKNSLGDDASPKLSSEAPKPRAIQQAAAMFNVPERKVRGAVAVKNCDPAIVAAVNRGEITLACAKTLAQFSVHQQAKWAAGGPAAMKNAAGGPAAMKNAARSAVADGSMSRNSASKPGKHDEEDDEEPAAGPRIFTKDERAARVERMSLLQKLKSFHNELVSVRGDGGPDRVLADWPSEQIDEAWDYVDRIQTELGLWAAVMQEGQ